MSVERVTRRALLSVAVPPALGAAVAGAAGLVPPGGEPGAPEPRMSDVIPDVPLIDHRGRRVRFYSDLVADRAVLLNFMYVKCRGSCPVSVALLRRLRPEFSRSVGRDAKILSITLDPGEDSPRALAEYARPILDHDAGPGLCDWHFLTGGKSDIEALRRALGYWDPDPRLDADRSQHASLLTFGNDRLDRWASLPVGIPDRQMLRAIVRITAGYGGRGASGPPGPTADASGPPSATGVRGVLP